MKKLTSTLVALLLSVMLSSLHAAGKAEINISNQMQFDRLDASLKTELKRGRTEISVTLQPGLYYYKEKHVNLADVNYPKANVTIIGNGALLVAKDLGQEHDWQDGTFLPQSLTDVDRWSVLVQSPEPVKVMDEKKKLCRIRIVGRQSKQDERQCKGQYIEITEWYDSKIYPIVRRDRKYIYFVADDLNIAHRGQWNVNTDVSYGQINPRYRTILPEAPASDVHFCQTSTFLNLWHSTLGSFTLKGLDFGPNNGKAPLLDTDMFNSRQLLIEECSFRGIRGMVVKVWFTDNVWIRSNRFEGCYQNGVESFSGSRKTKVTNNTFRNHGKGLRQNFGVVCRGEDFLVQTNTFRNFSYGAIGVGMWYGHQPSGPITGSVAENDIAFDPDYYNDYKLHTLMDGGAIYTWTLCDKVTIERNKINRYRGVKDYRGIFCDDGGKNITIRDNTVTNIGDGCWCIDLRWVENVSSHVPDHNTGNVMVGNKVDGKVRFETRRP